MKMTVLAAAFLTAFSMPAFAGDTTPAEETGKMTVIDPQTTSATTTEQSDMPKASVRKHGCMHGRTAMEMM